MLDVYDAKAIVRIWLHAHAVSSIIHPRKMCIGLQGQAKVGVVRVGTRKVRVPDGEYNST